jgi:hypothetical protein
MVSNKTIWKTSEILKFSGIFSEKKLVGQKEFSEKRIAAGSPFFPSFHKKSFLHSYAGSNTTIWQTSEILKSL